MRMRTTIARRIPHPAERYNAPMFSPSAALSLCVLGQPSLLKPPSIPFEPTPLPASSVSRRRPAQSGTTAATSGREYFVSWGYNGDSYTKSDLHINQPSLGNDFTLGDVRARDSKPWANILGHAPTVPQYNVRFGMFFNEKWGLEVAHDHMKWIVRQDQEVRMTGTLNGAAGRYPGHAYPRCPALPAQ